MNILEMEGAVITDGAWGTQMQGLGLPVGETPDAWNLTHPDRVQEVAASYCDAGSQIILTNTFRANRLALAGQEELASKIREINRAGAEISVRAAAGKVLVLGSIGPTGKMLMAGDVTEQEFAEAFAEQVEGLVEGGVDGFVIETMSDLVEAKIALQAAKQSGLPVVSCMVFDSGKELDRTMMGTPVEQAAKELTEAGADVIGANCGQGVGSYLNVCRRIKASTDRPIWIKANAGIPELIEDEVVYASNPSQFATGVGALVEAGAKFVGGCCGTSPDFIRAVRARMLG